jgi:hypothetical protein
MYNQKKRKPLRKHLGERDSKISYSQTLPCASSFAPRSTYWIRNICSYDLAPIRTPRNTRVSPKQLKVMTKTKMPCKTAKTDEQFETGMNSLVSEKRKTVTGCWQRLLAKFVLVSSQEDTYREI